MEAGLWSIIAALLIGLLAGILAGLAWGSRQRWATDELLERAENQRQAETDALLDGVKLAFADISTDTFRRASDDVMRLAQATLAGERRVQGERHAVERAELDARMTTVLNQLERMQQLVRELEQDRTGKFGELAAQLKQAGEGAQRLQTTTEHLTRALTNARSRGQWGERMAEDLLASLGLEEGVSYRRQATTPSGSRPDFTFLLPGERLLHMDVKFPLDNLLRQLDAEDPSVRRRHEAAFLRDVRQKIQEIAARGYVAPEEGTVDLALLLVPNEGVFRAMIESAPKLIDEALDRNVAIVSPVSCFAVLVVLRHLAGQWQLSRYGRELVQAVGGLERAWRGHVERSEAAEHQLEQVLEQMRKLNGRRRRTIDRAFEQLTGLGTSAPSQPDGQSGPESST